METIQDSVHRFLDKMKDVGYSAKSISYASAALYNLIVAHPDGAEGPVNRDIADKHICDIENAMKDDAVGNWVMSKNVWFVRKFLDFLETGIINADHYTKPLLPLEEGFASVIQQYVDDVSTNNQQKKSRAWAPKRYAFWLSNHGLHSFSDTQVTDLRQFLIEDTKNLKSKTVPNFRSELRRFHIWLYDHGYIPNTYEALFDFKVAIENKIHPAVLPDDAASVLSQIDRTTAIGKRDYVMILCGIVLGLRGCDVIRLKLTDIDWRQGEIRIAQHKTGKPLALPLTADVAEAMKDYILNGRPDTEYSNVFLRHSTPICPFSSGKIVGRIFSDYKKKAGLDFDGSYYSARRAVGKNLVTAGVPVTTVAQVLGHTDISNTKQYIALDTPHLKICALGFDGIMPRRWS
jgi:site-specific recombinase XerD